MGAAARLIGAYIVVRIGVLLFAASLGNKSWIQNWETRATLVIWLAIGLLIYFFYSRHRSEFAKK